VKLAPPTVMDSPEAAGARPGDAVTIGPVTFDWEPALLAGVNFTPTGRGTDPRLDRNGRTGAAERLVARRTRRGLVPDDVDGDAQ